MQLIQQQQQKLENLTTSPLFQHLSKTNVQTNNHDNKNIKNKKQRELQSIRASYRKYSVGIKETINKIIFMFSGMKNTNGNPLDILLLLLVILMFCS